MAGQFLNHMYCRRFRPGGLVVWVAGEDATHEPIDKQHSTAKGPVSLEDLSTATV